MRYRTTTLCFAAFAILQASCDSPSDNDELEPEDLVGTYVLATVDGHALPATTAGRTIYSGVLTLESADQYSVTMDNGCPTSASPFCAEIFTRETGEWVILYDGTLEFGNPTTFRAVARGDSIIVCPEGPNAACGSRYVYRRHEEGNGQITSIDVRPDSLILNLDLTLTGNVFASTTPYVSTINFLVKDPAIAEFTGVVHPRARGTTYVVGYVGNMRDSTKVIVR